jgi:hypothetical protein
LASRYRISSAITRSTRSSAVLPPEGTIDINFFIQPIPSPELQPASTTWEQHRANLVATGAKISAQAIDHGYLWGATYEAGKAVGMYADTIHPSDAGAASLASALRSALGM